MTLLALIFENMQRETADNRYCHNLASEDWLEISDMDFNK